jgi:hypothetical protein
MAAPTNAVKVKIPGAVHTGLISEVATPLIEVR